MPWFGADGLPIEDRAVNLAHKLTTRKLGDRPLIFITHSMGGLIVKEIVVQSPQLAGCRCIPCHDVVVDLVKPPIAGTICMPGCCDLSAVNSLHSHAPHKQACQSPNRIRNPIPA